MGSPLDLGPKARFQPQPRETVPSPLSGPPYPGLDKGDSSTPATGMLPTARAASLLGTGRGEVFQGN